MTFKTGLICAAATLLVAGHATASPTYGSVSKSTYRDCSATAATTVCDGTIEPEQRIVSQVTTGGFLALANSDLTLADGSFARGDVAFGALDLPTIHGSSFSAVGSQDRMNTNSMGFQSYVFGGPDGTAFSLTGSLHIDDSSTDGGAGALPLGAIYHGYVAIWDPSVIGPFTTADQIFNNVFLADCSTPGVLAVGNINGALAGGAADFSVTTTSCSGSPLLLTTGEEVLAVSGLQLPVNRGGFADASHTFVTHLDANLSATDRTALKGGLVSGMDALGAPEPGTWALMLTGFLATGVALRRRGRALA
jgi:hypothetical protein